MIFLFKQATFEWFLKPLIAICGIISIYGHLTGQPIEPMISAIMGYAFEFGVKLYKAAFEVLPLIIERLSEIDVSDHITTDFSQAEIE